MKESNLSKSCGLAALIFLLLSVTACSTTESSKGEGSEVIAAVEIYKGMEAADLLAALGDPYEIRSPKTPVEGTEIWVYRKVSEYVSLVVSGAVERPGMNIGGIPLTIKDDIYTPATTRRVEETQFLMVHGIVTAWKVDREGSDRLN